MMKPIKGMDAINHHKAFLPMVPKSFCATSTIAQIVANKNGTQRPTKITAVFIPIEGKCQNCFGRLENRDEWILF